MKRNRMRFPTFLLSLTLLFSCLSLHSHAKPELPFTDISQGAWYYKAVKTVYNWGLLRGTSATKYSPNEKMTRSMFMQVLANKTSNYNASHFLGKSSFTDVNPNAWYAPAIEWAREKGLASGSGNGKFTPENPITRQELAVTLYNYAQKTNNDTAITITETQFQNRFRDTEFISYWARNAMKWAVSHFIFNGDDNARLNPLSTAQRSEVAQIITNSLSVLVNDQILAPPTPTPSPTAKPTSTPIPTQTPKPTNVPDGSFNEEYAKEVLRLVNIERQKQSLPNLSWADDLETGTNIRTREIRESFSHTRPNGTPYYTALGSNSYRTTGENIAAGQQTPQAVVTAWMNSEGHRANILNNSFTKLTVGCYYTSDSYGYYWVQIFAG